MFLFNIIQLFYVYLFFLMLSPSELTSLYNIISDDGKTLQNISDIFHKTYPKSEQFKLGVTLWYLIKDNLINLSQRIFI